MNQGNLTVRAKLVLAFGGLAVMVALVAALSLLTLRDANRRFVSFVDGIHARAETAARLRVAVDRRAIAARNLVLVSRPADLEVEKGLVAGAHEDVQRELALLKHEVRAGADADADDRMRGSIDEIDRIEKSYGPVALAIVDLALHKQNEAAIAKMNDECRPLLAALAKATGDFADATELRSKALVQDAAAQAATQQWVLAGACALAFAAAGLAGLLISRNLRRALGAEPSELGAAAQRVAGGDLSPLAAADAAPLGSVMASLAAMQRSLGQVVTGVRQNADSVATASAQIAQGNQDLSGRTEEQASTLQLTASSMEQLSVTVQQNADNARQASELAFGASAVATRGGEVVAQVVGTMKGINDSSKKIADIIAVIDGIAFQTNILALNAAVEAARAGEQGRGFAVVASEVRSLAQRSAEAAKEIKTLITSSVEQVEQGSALVDRAGRTMDEIVGSIRRVTDIVGEISSASGEQSAGVSQVGAAVNEMDKATQQNAALVEQSAAAAESLRDQAQQLVRAVAVFKTEMPPALLRSAPASALAPAPARSAAKTPARAAAAAAPRPPVAVTSPSPSGADDDWTSF